MKRFTLALLLAASAVATVAGLNAAPTREHGLLMLALTLAFLASDARYWQR